MSRPSLPKDGAPKPPSAAHDQMTTDEKTPQQLLEEFAALPDVRQRIRNARKIVDDIDNQEELGRLQEIAADIQERVAELRSPKLRGLEMSSFVASTAPVPIGARAVPTIPADGAAPSKRERQIQAIVAAAIAQGYDVLNIPDRGETLLRNLCMAAHPGNFGAGLTLSVTHGR